MAAFGSVDAAGAGVTAIIASGIIPAGLELLDKPAIDAVEQFVPTGYPQHAAAVLLCELDGTEADVTAQIEVVERVFTQAGAIDQQVSHSEAERQRFWAGRKAAFPAMGRLSPDYYCMDGTIPRKHLAHVLKQIGRLSDEYGLPICNVFHAGDGNLHPLILYDANKTGELERTEELGGKILELCVEVGGTITGEHGVGLEKINQMCVQFTTAELQQFHAIKSAFDANNLLNPGKAIPTLHRCAEFGAMHVHHGALPHPELERF
jgi:glycolate oxidase